MQSFNNSNHKVHSKNYFILELAFEFTNYTNQYIHFKLDKDFEQTSNL